MSARADVVLSHISGKKFKKSLEWYQYNYSEFLPHIVEDRENSKRLYCKITKQPLNKIPEEVRKHMEGKRFKRYIWGDQRYYLYEMHLYVTETIHLSYADC